MSGFYVKRGEMGKVNGPIESSKLVELAKAGKILDTDLVSTNGEKWLIAAKVKGLFPSPVKKIQKEIEPQESGLEIIEDLIDDELDVYDPDEHKDAPHEQKINDGSKTERRKRATSEESDLNHRRVRSDNPRRPRRFSISIWNKTFYAIVAIFYIAHFVLFVVKTAENTGFYLVGPLLIYFVIPIFFSWIVWLIRKRRKGRGGMTFTMTLILLLLTQLVGFYGEVQNKILIHLEEQYDKDVLASNDRDDFIFIYDLFLKKYENALLNHHRTLTETDKEFFFLKGEFTFERGQVSKVWLQACSELPAVTLDKTGSLDVLVRFKERQRIINNYISASELNLKDNQNRIEALKQKLLPIGANSERYIREIEKEKRDIAKLHSPIIKLLKQHLEYANNLKTASLYVNTSKEHWLIINKVIKYKNKSMQNTFNDFQSNLANNLKAIDFGSKDLLETLKKMKTR